MYLATDFISMLSNKNSSAWTGNSIIKMYPSQDQHKSLEVAYCQRNITHVRVSVRWRCAPAVSTLSGNGFISTPSVTCSPTSARVERVVLGCSHASRHENIFIHRLSKWTNPETSSEEEKADVTLWGKYPIKCYFVCVLVLLYTHFVSLCDGSRNPVLKCDNL